MSVGVMRGGTTSITMFSFSFFFSQFFPQFSVYIEDNSTLIQQTLQQWNAKYNGPESNGLMNHKQKQS